MATVDSQPDARGTLYGDSAYSVGAPIQWSNEGKMIRVDHIWAISVPQRYLQTAAEVRVDEQVVRGHVLYY